MNTPIADMVAQMLATGVPHDAIVLAVRTTETCNKVSPAALRMRKFREKKRNIRNAVTPPPSPVTQLQLNSIKNNDLGRNSVTEKPPIIVREEEREDSKIVDIRPTADSRSVPRLPAGEFDWESSDGTIFISADQINRWAEMFPGVNIRAQLRGARREYLSGPITSEIFCRRFEKGLHTKAAKKRAKDQQSVEHKIVAQTAIEDDYERRQRALAVRNKYHGIGRG